MKNKHCEEKEQVSELGMEGILELSNREFKTMINMLRDLMDKVDSM